MRNIHVLPTEKPSIILKDDFDKLFYSINIDKEQNHFKPQHIYIISDEEIKEGDWFLHPFNTIHKAGGNLTDKDFKKIIITTDGDLIKDGVQAIDDEFLEWFVKNPTCESVVVKPLLSNNGRALFGYKIIIPKSYLADKLKDVLDNMSQEEFDTEWEKVTNLKLEGPSIIEEEPNLTNICIKCGVDLYATEGRFKCQKHPKECKGIYLSKEDLLIRKEEQKHRIINMMKDDEELGLYEEPKQELRKVCKCKRAYENPLSGICSLCWNEIFPDEKDEIKEEDLLEPKQETVAEAGVAYSKTVNQNHTSHMLGFINGAKWQQERMYSEEEIREAIDFIPYHLEYGNIVARKSDKDIENFIEQLKKK